MTRVLLGVAGLAAVGYGGWRLLDLGPDNLVATVTWLVGGVLLHDAVLAPLVVLVGWLAARRLPDRWRPRLAVALVLLGPLTLAAVPVLGRFGARPDNPTLLDRPYVAGWAGLVALVLAAVLLAPPRVRIQVGRRSRGPGAGGR